MVNPVPYSGVLEDCNRLRIQCLLALLMQPHYFPTERVNVALIISLLMGGVLQSAETFWKQAGPIKQSLNSFVDHFCEVFGKPQGSSITDYALKFCKLAATSGWNERIVYSL